MYEILIFRLYSYFIRDETWESEDRGDGQTEKDQEIHSQDSFVRSFHQNHSETSDGQIQRRLYLQESEVLYRKTNLSDSVH